jgi:hypothetical protein
VWQIGTAYFGCRDEQGRFDLAKLKDVVEQAPVRALEIKLSQGAKPGLGGMLPGAKVSAEIAATRGVAEGKDCISPSRHAEFDTVDRLLDWVEMLAAETGLPVGDQVGGRRDGLLGRAVPAHARHRPGRRLRHHRRRGGRDGRGADGVRRPRLPAVPDRLQQRLPDLRRARLAEDVVFNGSGKLGLPDNALVAMALGCDMVSVAREAMLSIGCIQAQKCHTDTCPTGVATQNPWLSHGLDPALKSVRCANYVKTLRRDLLRVAQACGRAHPGLIRTDDVEILDGRFGGTSLRELYRYEPGWGLPSEERAEEVTQLMAETAPTGGSAPASPTSMTEEGQGTTEGGSAAEVVLDALDVVLAAVVAPLHLDEDEGLLAGVGHPVGSADRHVDGVPAASARSAPSRVTTPWPSTTNQCSERRRWRW